MRSRRAFASPLQMAERKGSKSLEEQICKQIIRTRILKAVISVDEPNKHDFTFCSQCTVIHDLYYFSVTISVSYILMPVGGDK